MQEKSSIVSEDHADNVSQDGIPPSGGEKGTVNQSLPRNESGLPSRRGKPSFSDRTVETSILGVLGSDYCGVTVFIEEGVYAEGIIVNASCTYCSLAHEYERERVDVCYKAVFNRFDKLYSLEY